MSSHDIVSIKVLEELKSLLKQEDLSLLTRLLLDFLTEEDFGKELLLKAISIREQYNLLAGKSKEEVQKNKHILLKELEVLLESLQIASLNLKPKQKHAEELYQKGIENLKNDENVELSEKKVIFVGKGIVKKYNKSSFELGPIDIKLESGTLTGVVGENGNGKTTLLRIIAGELLETDGVLEYPFEKKQSWYDIKQNIAYIPQVIGKWHGLLKENLHFSAANHGIFGEKNKEAVNFIIQRLGLNKYENCTWKEISSGFRLRYELAKALVWRPKLLIMDEPLANLDINTKSLVLQDLKMISQSKKYPIAIILSSQQLYEIEKVVDNIIFIKDGKPIYNGPVKEIGSERISNTFELSGNFKREELIEALEDIQIVSLTDSGNIFILNVPLEVEGKEILNKISKKLKIDYFRDISQSSRKFFE